MQIDLSIAILIADRRLLCVNRLFIQWLIAIPLFQYVGHVQLLLFGSLKLTLELLRRKIRRNICGKETKVQGTREKVNNT